MDVEQNKATVHPAAGPSVGPSAGPSGGPPVTLATSAGEPSFVRLISTATGIKLILDTSVQIFNPFLALIAGGLGSNVVVLGRLISLRSIMGLFSPLFGALTGRIGYRRTIRISLWLAAAGIIVVGLSPNVWVAALGMGVMGLGTGSFVPLIHAYLSGRLPYSRRARGLGIVEYSWALTGIVGLSLVGLLIQATTWRVPMVMIGLLLLVAGFVMLRMPPSIPHGGGQESGSRPHTSAMPGAPQPVGAVERAVAYLHLPANALSTWATIVAGALNYFAAMQVMIIYGTWLGDVYGLGPAALGTVAFVFGIFDLTASVSVSLFTDRLGKKRSVILGCLVAVVGYLAAASMQLQMAGAIALVGLSRMGFEFAIVSHFPLLSEQLPAQRSKIMTLGSASSLTFATLSGLTAPWIYTHFAMRGVVIVSGIVTALAVVVLLLLVKDAGDPHP